MNIKKILAVLLALAMLFSFAACGGSDDEDVKGKIESDTEDVLDTEEEEDEEDDEKEDEKEEEEDDDSELELGKTKGSKYENEFIGLGVKIPSDWTFYDEEKIAEINGITQDYMDEELVEAVKQADYFYDMYAATEDSSQSINVMFEKGSKAQIKDADLEQIAETTIESVKKTYENYGFEECNGEVTEIKIDGKKFTGFTMISTINGKEIHQAGFLIKKGEYIASINITAASEDKLEELLDAFYLL